MLCCVALRYIILCYVILCYVILCYCIILFYIISLNITINNMIYVSGGVDEGWLYVTITRVAPPPLPPTYTFDITISEDQSLYQSILAFPSLSSGTVYGVTGEGNSPQFFGSVGESLVVIRQLTQRAPGQNRL